MFCKSGGFEYNGNNDQRDDGNDKPMVKHSTLNFLHYDKN